MRKKSFWYCFTHEVTILSEFADEWNRYWDRLTTGYYNTKCGLSNLVKWLPFIWRDRQWDYFFIYMTFAAKLRIQADHIEQHGIHKHKDRDVREMRLCAALLQRAAEEDYLINNPWYEKSDSLFGKIEMSTRDEDDDGLTRCVIGRPNVKTDADEKRERFNHKKAREYSERMMKQDLEMFCRIFSRKSRTWWD